MRNEMGMPVELSIKTREEDDEVEITMPADPVAAVAALATLVHTVAESVGVSDKELLEILSKVTAKED